MKSVSILNKWTEIKPENDPPKPRSGHTCSLYKDRLLFVFGGVDNEDVMNGLFQYDIYTNVREIGRMSDYPTSIIQLQFYRSKMTDFHFRLGRKLILKMILYLQVSTELPINEDDNYEFLTLFNHIERASHAMACNEEQNKLYLFGGVD